MDTSEYLEYERSSLARLKKWAAAHHVEWVETKAAHVPWRAAIKMNGEVQLIGVGKTLRSCLRMAYQMYEALK